MNPPRTTPRMSALFSSPYQPSASGPPSPKTEYASAASSPRLLEAGGRFPFGRRSGRADRRLLWLLVVVAAAFLIYHHDRAFKLGTVSRPEKELQEPIEPAQPLPASPPPASGLKATAIRGGYSPFYGGESTRAIDIASDPLPNDATLEERLDVWENAPGGRGDDDVEIGTFIQWNLEACGNVEEQQNTHMIIKSAAEWGKLNRTMVRDMRLELIDYMRKDVVGSAEMKRADSLKGRGIVYLAGNADTLQRVLWAVAMLRRKGCTLPVEIYHFPEEVPDENLREQLATHDAKTIAVEGQHRDPSGKSYFLKAHAIIASPYREILYMDSDIIVSHDPTYIFDSPGYKRLGWWAPPDLWKTSPNHGIWSIMGVRCRNEWEMEAGAMFIDKKRHTDTMLLTRFLLINRERWYYYSDGDKDMFRWALLALRKRWATSGRFVGAGGLPGATASGDYCSLSMIQHGADGKPLFVHYNLLKQVPSGVGYGFSWGRTKQMPLFDNWPATPSTARLGEPDERPSDPERRGLGDIDCDMLADADEYGVARAPAKEMVMRRAARELGVKPFYHGGWATSCLCIDYRYVDVRPKDRQEADEAYRGNLTSAYEAELAEWEVSARAAQDAGREPSPQPSNPAATYPDWSSPLEIVQWSDNPDLAEFERTMFLEFGFHPSLQG